MTNNLKKLADLGSPPVASTPVSVEQVISIFGKQNADILLPLLNIKNGFYAFEGALHVLSDIGTKQEYGVFEWNSSELWRREYMDMAEGCLFFAEDVFGGQFCLRDGRVFSFDPETGELKPIAESAEAWSTEILKNYEFWTGYPLAHDWQKAHGTLPIGSRLVATTPFVLGGEYIVTNLHAVESARAMRLRASIAMQIRDLPDGVGATLKVIE